MDRNNETMGTYKNFLDRMFYTSLVLIILGSLILGWVFYYGITN